MLGALFAVSTLAHDSGEGQRQDTDHRHGYVLKAGQGEKFFNAIIKASPESGTQGGVMILDAMTSGSSTGLHYHLEADEFFYVLDGHGTAILGKDEIAIEPGDVIFVPAGQDHKLVVADRGPLEILAFLDKPGLDQEFRELHRKFSQDWEQVTLKELNAIARNHGTIYRTLE